jgi:hypothetical protein
MPAVESFIKKPFTNEPLCGVMVYPNEYLISQGVFKGVNICFAPDSEYEFDIDGERMYRIFDHKIAMIL